ncbi:MAG: porin [Burkholderiales bacterium]
MKRPSVVLALAACFVATNSFAEPGVEEKLRILEQELDDLKAQMQKSAPQNQPSTRQISPNYASALDRAEALTSGATSFVGYGEAAYSKLRQSGNATADLTRFVFGIYHRFNDRLSFQSEVEWEHGVVSNEDRGESEIEQAWLNYKFSDEVNVKGGLFLIPLGITNETHEPPTYYGVFRNEVETRIIPSTWRELGFGVHGLVSEGLRYDVGFTTGFDSGKMDDPTFGIQSAHQEGQLANAHDLSAYGALNYRRPGLLLGGGVFTGNTGQNGQTNPLLKGVAASLTLWDLHAKYSVGRLDLQALYAAGTLGDADKLNAAILASPPASGPFAAPKSLKGAYVQAAYHAYKQGDFDAAPFVRLERFDIAQQEDPANGLFQDPNNFERVRTIGINFKIHPQVVLKTDVQRYATDKTKDRFDIGIGYMF